MRWLETAAAEASRRTEQLFRCLHSSAPLDVRTGQDGTEFASFNHFNKIPLMISCMNAGSISCYALSLQQVWLPNVTSAT